MTALRKPVDFDQLYPGKFLKAGEFLGKQVTLTITNVDLEELEGDDKKIEVKGVISFKETPKQLCLNKTNGLCLKAMFGRIVTAWTGKRVTLFPGQHAGDPAIRVHGSPDIAETFDVRIKLAKKKATFMTMHKVEAKGAV